MFFPFHDDNPTQRTPLLTWALIAINVVALLVLGFWFVGQLLAGRDALIQGAPGGVAWWAHVGGFVAGLALMPVVSMLLGVHAPRKRLRRTTEESW